MGTRAVVGIQLYMNGTHSLYYRHWDGNPRELGLKLVNALLDASRKIALGAQPTIVKDELVKECGLEDMRRCRDDMREVFPSVQGDLDYVYGIDNLADGDTASIQFFRTSNPLGFMDDVDFAFPIWFSYVLFFPQGLELKHTIGDVERMGNIAKSALFAYNRATRKVAAAQEAKQP